MTREQEIAARREAAHQAFVKGDHVPTASWADVDDLLSALKAAQEERDALERRAAVRRDPSWL